MNEDLVISVKDISKSYRIWETPSARLTAPLMASTARVLPGGGWLRERAARSYRDFHALRGISLEVRRGQAVGIIGRNGSGKSTLLQIIAGTLQPTQGTVAVNGRVAALLELGSGFNPEFTGRENIYLNGSVLGLSPSEIDERYDEIAAFAEIGDFINQPVRTYSSGMSVRLAFAVAAHVDPAILIVDEALSVGDARFQLKCARAIDRFIERGVSLLFVSHDYTMIKRLCSHALLLDSGRALYAGHPNDVVNLYSKLTVDGSTAEGLAADIAALRATPNPASRQKAMPAAATASVLPRAPEAAPPQPADTDELKELRLRVKALETVLSARPDSDQLVRRLEELWRDERRHVQVSGQEFSYGGELGKIHEVTLLDREGAARTWFNSGEPMILRVIVEAFENLPEPVFAMTIKNAKGVEIYGTNTLFSQQPTGAIDVGSRREITFTFDSDLMAGDYFISVGFTQFVGEELVIVHRRYDVIKFEIHGVDRTFGIANLHAKISARNL